MSLKTSVILVSTLVLGTLSMPLPATTSSSSSSPTPPLAITPENLIAIAPATASCNGAPFPDECADAPRAAAALSKSFQKYAITKPGEQAALVAYTLFESANYKYSKNHYPAPGRPGQGTRMMAMPTFVSQYATQIAGADAVSRAAAAGGDAGATAVLALANKDDESSFGSAAWFLTTHCSPQVRAGLVAETTDGWHAFLTDCVGTSLDPGRDTPWIAAKQIILGAAQ